MTNSEDKKESIVSKLVMAIAVPTAIALIAGGTSPWWWSEFFGKGTDTSESTIAEQLTTEEEKLTAAAEKLTTEKKQRIDDRAAYEEMPVSNLAGEGKTIQGTDPREIAFNLLGRDSLKEGEQPSSLEHQTFTEYSVVTIANSGVRGDSVGGFRHRLEFEKIDDQRWQITWAGWQRKCLRGGNAGTWTKHPCP